jgi:hypothetical protein
MGSKMGRIRAPGGHTFEFDDDDVLSVAWRFEPSKDGTFYRPAEGDRFEVSLAIKDKRDPRWNKEGRRSESE